MTTENKKNNPTLPPFWLDGEGNDHTARFNFYRFCQLIEGLNGGTLGTGRAITDDPVRFRPNPHLGFPAGELKRTETDPDNPDAPPTIRTNFFGLYGVDSPLPTAIIDDINQGRDGADAMAAFLDIFNHRLMTQFYRIWKKYSYPATFEDGGVDNISQSLMALTGIAHGQDISSSRLLAILQPLLQPTHTAEGIAAVIRSQAPNTEVNVFPHHPVRMPVSKRARLSLRDGMTLDQHPILGDETTVAGYCSRVELSTENSDEAKGWMPDGQLKQDVMALLRTYLGCDYDVRLWLTIPTRLLPVPRLGDSGLFSGYNMMLGLRDDNLGEMPKTTRIKVGRLREDSPEFGRV
ncbi:type VI secretion system baseplate subunit TssG [Enterobacteriaceae bacterium Kacie_13]|nr:type VI secretion system baseplate subunit TssG [Enterobacteriaceae bacterium Kacie_13]